MTLQRGISSAPYLHALAAALTLLAFVAMLGLELVSSRRHEIERAKHEIATQAELLATHVGDRLGKIDIVLSTVARQYPLWAGWPTGQVNDELAAHLRGMPDSQSLRVGNAQGSFIFDASGKLSSATVFDRDYFHRLRADPAAGMVLSEPIFARITKNWVITLSRRLASPDGGFVGHVQAAINANQFETLFSQMLKNQGDVVALYDDQIRLVARKPAAPEQLGKKLAATHFESVLASGQTAADYQAVSPLDGVERHFALRKVEGLPLSILVGRSEPDILREWYVKAQVYGVSTLLLGLVLAALLWAWQRNYRLALRFGDAMEAAYLDSERRARTLLDSIPDPAWLRDCTGRFLMVNDAYLAFCGQSRAAVIGRMLEEVWPARHAALYRRQDSEVIAANAEHQGVGEQTHADGRRRTYEYVHAPLHDAAGRVIGVAGFARDVTPRKEAEARADYLAEHDALTDLPNRLLLSENIAQTLAGAAGRENRIALLLLDLDHFKHINDTLGHAIGDQLLRELAGRLKKTVFDKDLIARQGGDEFAILVVDWHSVNALAQIAQRVLDAVRQPFTIDDRELLVTASIGISLYPDDGNNIDHLLRNADVALYAAKSAGRNAYCFFKPEMNARVAERVTLESRLRKAIAERRLLLHYQPQYELTSGRMVGVEALVRWQDPIEGLISPARFIPLAEETGLIKPLGEWVLNEACRQAVAWQDAGLPLFIVAVNLSAVQLADPEIVAIVRQALADSGLPAARLELEITESMLLADAERAIAVLEDFRAMGVKLAIDDFGTGYSSFSYLKRLPLDKLKVDQSFVSDLTVDANNAAIVEAIIAVAGKLGLRVIAEGAETAEQVEMLRRFGCDEVQGYYFSRPLPPAEIAGAQQRGKPG